MVLVELSIAKSFRRVLFRIRKHFWLLSTGKWYFSIAFASNVNGIHQRKSRTIQQVLRGFGIIYVEGHRRVLEITTDILNIVSNNCKYGSCGFCFDFSFHLVFTINVTRFALRLCV
jgi:hypothetical protein